MQPTTYSCKVCGAPVPLVKAVPVPTCKCNGGIVAHLRAVAKGTGGVK